MSRQRAQKRRVRPSITSGRAAIFTDPYDWNATRGYSVAFAASATIAAIFLASKPPAFKA
jgi:hypothetical protein